MRVCNLWAFNLALLSKWWWWLFHDTHTLWVAIVLHNYYRRRRPYDLYSTIFGYVSFFWRGVLKTSMAFTSGINIKVRDGCMARFLLDYWVCDVTLASLFLDLFLLV